MVKLRKRYHFWCSHSHSLSSFTVHSDRRKKSTGNYFHAFYSLVKIYSFKAAKPQKKEEAEQAKKRKHYITSCSEREIQWMFELHNVKMRTRICEPVKKIIIFHGISVLNQNYLYSIEIRIITGWNRSFYQHLP